MHVKRLHGGRVKGVVRVEEDGRKLVARMRRRRDVQTQHTVGVVVVGRPPIVHMTYAVAAGASARGRVLGDDVERERRREVGQPIEAQTRAAAAKQHGVRRRGRRQEGPRVDRARVGEVRPLRQHASGPIREVRTERAVVEAPSGAVDHDAAVDVRRHVYGAAAPADHGRELHRRRC